MTTTRQAPYPLPTEKRRRIVQELSEIAQACDAEAQSRIGLGSHNNVVRHELLNSAAALRLVCTLIVQGGMSTKRAEFWLVSARQYMSLVQSADRTGVIR